MRERFGERRGLLLLWRRSWRRLEGVGRRGGGVRCADGMTSFYVRELLSLVQN